MSDFSSVPVAPAVPAVPAGPAGPAARCRAQDPRGDGSMCGRSGRGGTETAGDEVEGSVQRAELLRERGAAAGGAAARRWATATVGRSSALMRRTSRG
eukprot:SAG31_NODE_1038_length_10218_cov_16.418223_1_plen_98_part_00